MITVNSRNFDGTVRKTWHCELLERRGSLLIFVGEFDADIHHADLGYIQKGSLSYEYYWTDRWYNIFRFHEPSGALRNFYGNVCMPPTFEHDTLDYVDLEIDLLVDVNFRRTVLDREDYERSAAAYGYGAELDNKVEEALHQLLQVFEERNIPGVPELFATSAVAARECG